MRDSNEELLERARMGDRPAFDQLIEAHRPRLLALIRSRVGAGLQRFTEVEDVYQETVLRAFRAVPELVIREEDGFFRWISCIAVHRILEIASRAATRREVPLETAAADPPSPGDTTPSRALRREERFERLRAAIDMLPPECRQILLLARIDGLAVQEIARRLGKSPNAISQSILRALRTLREILGETESFSLPRRDIHGSKDGPDVGPNT